MTTRDALLQAYADRRDAFLKQVVADLQTDPRFVAAWLAGSFGRGEADLVSDLDLHVVVTDDYALSLLVKPLPVWANSTPERLALLQRFGTPVIVHENHWNAICEGTFTYCEYADLVKVDWTLMAHAKAIRPHFTRLLFEHSPIPYAPAPQPETLEVRKVELAEQVGYFWLMTASGCKYLIRKDMGEVIRQFSTVHDVLDEIERLQRGELAIWGRRYLGKFVVPDADVAAWVQRVRALCAYLVSMYPRIEQLIGEPLTPAPTAVIDQLLALVIE